MTVERTFGAASLIDVLDRVLDKGIVIDAWVRVSLVGIDLITEKTRVVVASSETHLQYSEPAVAAPRAGAHSAGAHSVASAMAAERRAENAAHAPVAPLSPQDDPPGPRTRRAHERP